MYPNFENTAHKALEDGVTTAISSIPFGEIFPAETTQVEIGKVFVGAPMASLPGIDYPAFQSRVSQVAEAIEICCSDVVSTYWAGQEITGPDKFDGEQIALIRDLQQLKSSSACIFIFFESVVSSVLVEVGYAIALNKRTVIFCKNRSVLPFLLKRADDQIANVSIYEVKGFDDIEKMLDKDGEAIISNRTWL